jgi:Sec-independent protein translocase protein TatA
MYDALIKATSLMVIMVAILLILGEIAITVVYGHWGYAIGEIFIILFFAALYDLRT